MERLNFPRLFLLATWSLPKTFEDHSRLFFDGTRTYLRVFQVQNNDSQIHVWVLNIPERKVSSISIQTPSTRSPYSFENCEMGGRIHILAAFRIDEVMKVGLCSLQFPMEDSDPSWIDDPSWSWLPSLGGPSIYATQDRGDGYLPIELRSEDEIFRVAIHPDGEVFVHSQKTVEKFRRSTTMQVSTISRLPTAPCWDLRGGAYRFFASADDEGSVPSSWHGTTRFNGTIEVLASPPSIKAHAIYPKEGKGFHYHTTIIPFARGNEPSPFNPRQCWMNETNNGEFVLLTNNRCYLYELR